MDAQALPNSVRLSGESGLGSGSFYKLHGSFYCEARVTRRPYKLWSQRCGHSWELLGSHWTRQLSSSFICLSPDEQGVLLQHIQLTLLKIHGLHQGEALESLWNPWIHRLKCGCAYSIPLGTESSAFPRFTLSSPHPLVYSSITHIPCWAPILLPAEAAILTVKVGESIFFVQLFLFAWHASVYNLHKSCVLT